MSDASMMLVIKFTLRYAGMLENNINQERYISHKSYPMSGTTDDNLGRRLFLVQKEKAVEDALEKIRRRTGPEWSSITSSDREILKNILGEVWITIERPRWSTYSFSKLSITDLNSIIALGKEVIAKKSMSEGLLSSLDAILQKEL